ncbi:uncharacterized protein LOC144101103 isoform X1 [Amblyomma americanum]
MTDETSESVETQTTENHVRIKTPDGHSPGTGECVKLQCTTTGNECSPKDGAVTGCATSAAQTDADTFKADAAEASGGEIQENGEVDSCAGNDMEDTPFDKEEDWDEEIEAAYACGKTIDTKDDNAESEDWDTEIAKPCYITATGEVPEHPYVFLPADIHAESVLLRAPTFHVVEGQFDDADSDT